MFSWWCEIHPPKWTWEQFGPVCVYFHFFLFYFFLLFFYLRIFIYLFIYMFLFVFWLQIAIEPFVMFHHCVYDYMCLNVMFYRWGRGPLCRPNRSARGSVQARKLQCCIWSDSIQPSLQFSWFCVFFVSKGHPFWLLFVILSCIRLKVRFHENKTDLSIHQAICFPTDCSKAVFLLQFCIVSASMASYQAFVLSSVVPNLYSFWCVGF